MLLFLVLLINLTFVYKQKIIENGKQIKLVHFLVFCQFDGRLDYVRNIWEYYCKNVAIFICIDQFKFCTQTRDYEKLKTDKFCAFLVSC